MTESITYGTPESAGEIEELGRVLIESFGFVRGGRSPSDVWREYHALLGPENYRCLREGGRVVAGLGLYRVGQWFGGRRVRMDGVAAVGVAPEARGKGVARQLMTELMRELHADGVALATLYASTSTLYRKVGFERAGTSCRFELPADRIGRHSRALPVEPVDPSHPALRASYERWAPACPGVLDRDEIFWKRLVAQRGSPVYAFVVGSTEAPEGHVILTHELSAAGGYDLEVRELVASTPAAAERLWAFLADHRSLARQVRWTGPCTDAMLALTLEHDVEVVDLEYWMLRVVDVVRALSERGYRAGVEATLQLAVTDPLLPANDGRFVLRVADGRGHVTRGGDGDLAVSIRGLAPLYTGLLSAVQLARVGWLAGPDEAFATADRLFAGAEPWMTDRF